MLGFYETQLIALVGVCVLSLLADRYLSQSRKRKLTQRSLQDHLESGQHGQTSSVGKLARQYLIVYAIVMGADWLQGPYVYSLYHEQYKFPERLVAVLFVTGFVSAGLTAPLIGAWADQHGRRFLCLTFCVTYTLSCLCILIPWVPILLVGRVLGGISTSILFSVFDSWLISSASSNNVSQSDLSQIMGRATVINGLVATGAGVVSNELVSRVHNFASPFMASAALLVFSWTLIRSMWHENYGSGDGKDNSDGIFQTRRLAQAVRIVRRDPFLLVLGLTQTCFEGSMYLFVFLWVPSLQEAATEGISLPLGFIFSCFMLSMMLGSLLYTAVVSISGDSSVTQHAKLSSLVCAVSACALTVSIISNEEHVRFWAFCVFESCVGMYYPVQGMLRGSLIADEQRATLSSLFRVPLNIFVVVSLLTGVSSARHAVMTASALMLTFSSILTGAVIVNKAESQESHSRENSRPS